MLKVMFINPVGTEIYDDRIRKTIEEIKRTDVNVTVTHISNGPSHLEYDYYKQLVMIDLLNIVRKAEKDGYDAVVIGCFADPGLHEARELVKIPVVAPAEVSLRMAASLGHKFTIIAGRRKWLPGQENLVYQYGVEKKFAGFRLIDFTVDQLGAEPQKANEAILKEARKAIEEDGVEVIVLGCTIESGFMKELIKKLGTPVLDPVVVSWKYAEMMADMYRKLGLAHSKLFTYEPPPEDNWLQ